MTDAELKAARRALAEAALAIDQKERAPVRARRLWGTAKKCPACGQEIHVKKS